MAKSFKQLVKKTSNKKTRAIAKKRTKELTREVIHAKLIFGELTFGEFYKFLCKRLHNRRPASVLVVKKENHLQLNEEFHSHCFELHKNFIYRGKPKTGYMTFKGTKGNEGWMCSAKVDFDEKVKIRNDVVEVVGQDVFLTFFHEPPSIDVFKQISGS